RLQWPVLTWRNSPGCPPGDDGRSPVPSSVLLMPASEVRRGPASPEEQVASEQVSSLPALWRPGPQALIPLQEVLRGAALAGRKQEPGLRGVWPVSTYESRPLSSGVAHETAARRTRLRLLVMHRGNRRWTGSSGRAR